MNHNLISGFSGLSKLEKLGLVSQKLEDPELFVSELKSFWHADQHTQQIFDGFSENTISNFYLPYGVAPNFLVNGKEYMLPMVIEESSVVAAASSSARFWYQRGGFVAEVLSEIKTGQVYFTWNGTREVLLSRKDEIEDRLRKGSAGITRNMEKRGGGISGIEIIDMTGEIANTYQLKASFNTVDSMGANFINTCLEEFGKALRNWAEDNFGQSGNGEQLDIVMAILSNYTPECLVRSSVECEVRDLDDITKGMSGIEFVRKFSHAIQISEIDPYRAVTHNKGIFNGIDAVVLATGNDFRAVEAGAHAYAARSGKYTSLTRVEKVGERFKYILEMPLSVGTVGGLTGTHPLARQSMNLLGNPGARELMGLIASAGLANNFAAIRSLVTSGIQKGHMKMHLSNILTQLNATKEEGDKTKIHFRDRNISYRSVVDFLDSLRNNPANG